MKRSLRMITTLVGASIGYRWSVEIGFTLKSVLGRLWPSGGGLFELSLPVGLMALVGYLAALVIGDTATRMFFRTDAALNKMPTADLLIGAAGLLFGLITAALLYPLTAAISWNSPLLPLLVTAILTVLGYRLGLAKKAEIFAFFGQLHFGKEQEDRSEQWEEHKILDTSVIIDGRIADICKTGFIEGTLVIPGFILEELQHIADSSDLLKRNRGRRGLDILNKIQKELDVKVLIYEGDFDEISEVDSKLVRLAKVLNGKVLTNDFNLNKVCELQGVSVLNINDLANAVKPVVLPGEEIVVQVIKDGKEHGQGVAYLDDGTMIVVEGGRDFIGTTMEAMVTSVLQTSAGRMIFAKPKLLEKAQ